MADAGDEIGAERPRALVEKLVEGVLAVGFLAAPDHRRGVRAGGLSVSPHRLAVALHLQLLEVARQRAQAVVVGEHGMSRRAAEVGVPHLQQGEQQREVRIEGRVLEVAIDQMRAGQQVLEAGAAEGDGNRQPHRRPQREAPARGIPDVEAIGRRQAELVRRLHVRGCRQEVFGERLRVAGAFEEPALRQLRVEARLEGLEALRGDHDQRCCGIQPGERCRAGGAVHVGEKADRWRVGSASERLQAEFRPEVRAADADVQHALDRGVR